MRKIIILAMICFILHPACAFSLSNKLYDQYMKRQDFRSADTEMNKNWKKLKALLNEDDFRYLLGNQRKWVKNGRETEVQYLRDTQPFYDQCRMYAISSHARALFLGQIARFLQDNPDYTQEDIDDFISNLDYLQILNNVAHQFEPNADSSATGIEGGEYVRCSYLNDDTLGTIMGIVGGAVSLFSSGTKSLAADLTGKLLSNAEKHKFWCKFNPNVRSYAVVYFYSGKLLDERFRERETKKLSQKERVDGVAFSTMTGKTNLDYITIQAEAEDDGDVVRNLYAYKVDRKNNSLQPLDASEFMRKIGSRYEER